MKWIKHDTDANQDAKLQNVLLDYGLEGYGLYWYCIELIAGKVDKDNITFELEHDARIIARNVGSTAQKVEEMMRYFVELGLFENCQGTITCLKLAKRLDKSMTSNPEMRSIIAGLNANNTQLDGYVYIIEKTDRNGVLLAYKIGRSKNPSSRLSEVKRLDENIGFNLSLVCKVKSEDCVSLETEMHRKFKEFNLHNEWFEPRKEIIDYVMTIPDYVMQDKIRLDKNRIDKKTLDQSKIARAQLEEDSFEYWWKEYPKKVAKQSAFKAWKKVIKKMDDETVTELTNHIVNDVKLRLDDLATGSDKFIGFDRLHPTTYLNQERYNDDI